LLKLKDRTAVVTGAASGIGQAIAIALSGRGCHLALADIDEGGMAKTAEQVAARGVRVSQHRLDVSDPGAVAGFPDRIIAEHGGADLLVNNAGVALGGTFEQITESDFEWLFAINFWGVVRMTRAFLPLLRRSEEGHIVNISSLYGLIAPPGQTAYAASKFAVRGFSMSLRHELEGTGIGVTVVHPGGVATSIAKNARVAKSISAGEAAKRRRMVETLLTMPPQTAGEIIVRGVERRKPRILVGTDAKIASVIERLFPVSYWKLIGRKRTV
jgi:NAD(P)-dependent dehydrogenase (short-subunit alcohol dehydrogenase family)